MSKDSFAVTRGDAFFLGLMALGLTCLIVYFISYRLQHPDLVQRVKQESASAGDRQTEIMAMVGKLMERVKKDPQDKQGLFTLAHVFMKMEIWDQAIVFWKKFLQLSPGDHQARQQLAWCYFKSKDFARAVEELDKVLSADPDNVYALYNQGIIYKYFLHKPALAAKRFDQVVKLHPQAGDILGRAQEELAQSAGVEAGKDE